MCDLSPEFSAGTRATEWSGDDSPDSDGKHSLTCGPIPIARPTISDDFHGMISKKDLPKHEL
jgi:hypothetical protein